MRKRESARMEWRNRGEEGEGGCGREERGRGHEEARKVDWKNDLQGSTRSFFLAHQMSLCNTKFYLDREGNVANVSLFIAGVCHGARLEA